MNRTAFRVLVAAASFAVLATSASAQELLAEPGREGKGHSGDNVHHPLGKKQFELRQQGLQKLLKGQRQAKGPTRSSKSPTASLSSSRARVRIRSSRSSASSAPQI